MSKGILRRLIDVYVTNGIDEKSAAQFARDFLAALEKQPAGTKWFVRGKNGAELAVERKGSMYNVQLRAVPPNGVARTFVAVKAYAVSLDDAQTQAIDLLKAQGYTDAEVYLNMQEH